MPSILRLWWSLCRPLLGPGVRGPDQHASSPLTPSPGALSSLLFPVSFILTDNWVSVWLHWLQWALRMDFLVSLEPGRTGIPDNPPCQALFPSFQAISSHHHS